MLDDVLDAYLGNVSERDFDAPLMALLRADGFYDIHHTHGAFEFAKDFIAKRVDDGQTTQYAFQSKAGNIGIREWRQIRPQVDELRYNTIAHPAFDKDLPRRALLVVTGKLVGGAALDAQQYREVLLTRGELSLTVWDKSELMHRMLVSPEAGLVGWVDGPLMGILSRLGSVTDLDIELFSRQWIKDSFERSALVAAILADRLSKQRADMSCFVTLCLIRASMYRSQAIVGRTRRMRRRAAEERLLATKLFHTYADRLWARCSADYLNPDRLYLSGVHDILTMVTYPVRCSRLMELLGVYGLSLDATDPKRNDIRDYLAAFLANHPGAAHPISNHWAVSLLPPALLLGRSHRQGVAAWLEALVVWTADRYESALGLARPRSSPTAEVDVLLGAPFEHVAVRRNWECFIATTVLDVLCLTGLDALYHDALNDFLAVGVALPAIEAVDQPGQFIIGESGVSVDVNVPYDDTADVATSWKAAAHHRRAPERLSLQEEGCGWEYVAASLVLRDRYFLAPMRALLAAPV